MERLGANDRSVIGCLEKQYAVLHAQYCGLIRATPDDALYYHARPNTRDLLSIGENVLRGAAAVEQVFGGLTANLWDDPFEWTLPETLSTAARIIEYLEEVEATRQRAFASLAGDADLLKQIMCPSGETQPLIVLLTETLVKTAEYYGRAAATASFLHAIPGLDTSAN